MYETNEILKKFSNESNLTYMGNYPDIDFILNSSLFTEDNWHPSKEGHTLIAEQISEAIIKEGIINLLVED